MRISSYTFDIQHAIPKPLFTMKNNLNFSQNDLKLALVCKLTDLRKEIEDNEKDMTSKEIEDIEKKIDELNHVPQIPLRYLRNIINKNKNTFYIINEGQLSIRMPEEHEKEAFEDWYIFNYIASMKNILPRQFDCKFLCFFEMLDLTEEQDIWLHEELEGQAHNFMSQDISNETVLMNAGFKFM